MKSKPIVFGGRMMGKRSYHSIQTIEQMKKMKVGQTIWLASKENDSLFIKIPMVQKEVTIVFDELDEPPTETEEAK